MLLLCSAFTPPPTSDVISPGLVDDGVKCASGKMCYEQRCVSVSTYQQGLAQCPTGSNGRVCSGNGVSITYILHTGCPVVLKPLFSYQCILSIRCAIIGDSAHAILDLVAVPVPHHQVCAYNITV